VPDDVETNGLTGKEPGNFEKHNRAATTYPAFSVFKNGQALRIYNILKLALDANLRYQNERFTRF